MSFAPVVQIESGAVRGLADGNVNRYFGIPFAAPPVGPLRWKPPQPVAPWNGVRDTVAPGNWSLQTLEGVGTVGSEDCLYLNVTTPPTPAATPRAVLVWFHGGSWTMAGGDWYDPRRLVADGDIIVVTANYRLGLLGFLSHPALDTPGSPRASGESALEDQQAALAWVQRNIAAFGGDPGNVAIGGESAGGISVICHLMSPAARGLFHKAIVHCTAGLSTFPPGAFGPTADHTTDMTQPREEAYATGRKRAAALGLGEDATADELRALPAEAFLTPAATGVGSILAVRGGKLLPLDFHEASRRGDFPHVPVLTGNARDEHTLFALGTYDLAGQPITAEAYPAIVEKAFGPHAGEVLARYPAAAFPSPGQAFATLMTDAVWALNSYRLASRVSPYAPAWLFAFADDSPRNGPPSPLEGLGTIRIGVGHAAEMAFLYNVKSVGEFDEILTAGQQALARTMVGYWTRFVKTGDPNGEGAPAWAAFTPEGENAQRFTIGAGGIAGAGFSDLHKAKFWDAIR